jgi:hypothetical protein
MLGAGVAGGKGPLLMAIQALEMLLRAAESYYSPSFVKSIPLNVKFLFEGEGACGSGGLRDTLKTHAHLFTGVDVILAAAAAGTPGSLSMGPHDGACVFRFPRENFECVLFVGGILC